MPTTTTAAAKPKYSCTFDQLDAAMNREAARLDRLEREGKKGQGA